MSSCKAAHFTDLSRLQQHEIAYLNICSWFYPQYLELTKYLETLDLAITYNGQKYPIKSWGLYHSLIGDLNTKSKRFSGGHCNYQNMLANYVKIEPIEQLIHGFQHTKLRNIKKPTIHKSNTLFPAQYSPKKCIETIVDAIKNPKKISLLQPNKYNSFEITNQNNIIFEVHLSSNQNLTFYPSKKYEKIY